MTDIIFRILGDASQIDRAFGQADKAMQGLQRTQANTTSGLGSLNRATALTRQEINTLNYTISDVAASLASGASPFTILLQQGGQVRDAFGGFGPLFGKVGAALGPVGIAAGTVAVAVGSLWVAAYKGWQESNRLAASLWLNNNAAGVTTDSIARMSREVSELARSPLGAARAAIEGLAGSGAFLSGNMAEAGRVVVALAKYSGQTTDEVVKDLSTMRTGVARWAAEHNRAYNYLTVEVYRHIRALEAQGRTQEAIKVNLDALNQRLGTTMPRSLGWLEASWEAVTKKASNAWEAMKGIGRAETVQERIDSLTKALNEQVARGPINDMTRGIWEKRVDGLRTELASLQEMAILQRKSAEAQSANALKNQQDIERESGEYQSAALTRTKAQYTAQEKAQELTLEKQRIALERSYMSRELSAGRYLDKLADLDSKALDAKEAAINAELALERARPVDNPSQRIEQEARLLEIESRRYDVMRDRARLELRRQTQRAAPNIDQLDDPELRRNNFLRMERDLAASDERYRLDRERDAQELRAQLVDINRQTTVDLINDDRQRGMAQIALDEETIRKRLDLVNISAEGRQRVEDDLATWRALREKQLTEQLKPEWQRQLESYRDTNRLMREAFDTTMDRLTSAGEEAWVEFARTGKLSVKSLVNVINEELARVQWRKYLAQPASNIFSSILGMFGLGGGSGGGTGSTGGGGVTGGIKVPAGFDIMAVQGHIGGVMGMGGGTPRSIPAGLLSGAPRFHTGGLAVDEMPAVLRKGEEVLTRDDPRHVLNGGGRGGLNVTNNFHVPPGYSPAAYAGAVAAQQKASEDRIYAQMLRPGSRMRRAAKAA